MDLVAIFEQIKMGLVFVGIIVSVAVIFLSIRDKEFSDEVIYPWEKEERRAAKKAEKEKLREKRRQEKYWRNVEKQYR